MIISFGAYLIWPKIIYNEVDWMKDKRYSISVGMILIMFYYVTTVYFGNNDSFEAIWKWISCSENAAALQAIGSIAQVLTAILTLVAMVILGFMQHAMSKNQEYMIKRQIDISLYKSKEELYCKLMRILEKVTNFDDFYKICNEEIDAADFVDADICTIEVSEKLVFMVGFNGKEKIFREFENITEILKKVVKYKKKGSQQDDEKEKIVGELQGANFHTNIVIDDVFWKDNYNSHIRR